MPLPSIWRLTNLSPPFIFLKKYTKLYNILRSQEVANWLMLIIKLSCSSLCFCQDANCFCLFNGGILFANIEHLKNKKLKGKTATTLLSNGGTHWKKIIETLMFWFWMNGTFGDLSRNLSGYQKILFLDIIHTYICLKFLKYCFQFFKEIHPPVTTYILQFL